MGVEELQAKIESYQRKLDEALDKGDDDAAERYGIEVQKLERKLVKEEARLPVHPASVSLFLSFTCNLLPYMVLKGRYCTDDQACIWSYCSDCCGYGSYKSR
jgi:hypothetical protein